MANDLLNVTVTDTCSIFNHVKEFFIKNYKLDRILNDGEAGLSEMFFLKGIFRRKQEVETCGARDTLGFATSLNDFCHI